VLLARRAVSRHHDQGGVLREGQDEVRAAAVAVPRPPSVEGREARSDRLRGRVRAAGSHRAADAAPGAPLPTVRHTFIYSNKTWNDIIYRDELARLERAHPDRLRVVHTITREPEGFLYSDCIRKGRVCAPLLAEIVPDLHASVVYACGPAVTVWEKREAKATGTTPTPRFMESVMDALHELQMPKERIKEEAFG
jgi:NAD(P)H-flavin reductase